MIQQLREGKENPNSCIHRLLLVPQLNHGTIWARRALRDLNWIDLDLGDQTWRDMPNYSWLYMDNLA